MQSAKGGRTGRHLNELLGSHKPKEVGKHKPKKKKVTKTLGIINRICSGEKKSTNKEGEREFIPLARVGPLLATP